MTLSCVTIWGQDYCSLHYIMQPYAIKVYGECGDKATHIHNLSTRWMLLPSFTFSLPLLLGREVFWTG